MKSRAESNANSAYSKALNMCQVPPTADYDKILAFYTESAFMEELTGEKYHVDHIMPLARGGFHHQGNLQVIPARENLHKHTKITHSIDDLDMDDYTKRLQRVAMYCCEWKENNYNNTALGE